MNRIRSQRSDMGYLDELAGGRSFLHRLDPRVKVATTVAFIVAVVSFDKYALSALVPFFIYPIALIVFGGLPARYFIKKILIVSPFALMIGIFNPLIDRQTLFYIGTFGVSGGWVSFLSILARFTLTVSAALCLVALTGFDAVCAGIEKFGMPRPFVAQLLFLYRYLFVLTEEAERMVRARSLRTFESAGMGFKVFASLTGGLLMRAMDRAERVYQAMRCRGFDGHVRICRPMRIAAAEIRFAAGWFLLFALMRCYPPAVKIGSWLTGAVR